MTKWLIFQNSVTFCTFFKNRYNSHVHAPIWLKFSTHIGGLKGNTSINFGENLTIVGFISGFLHKGKANFCHAYRVNRFKEKFEN